MRPKIHRFLCFRPHVRYYKPQGIPMRELEEVAILPDELEAINLYEVKGLSQKEAAASMHISQPTFARILDKAIKKIAHAIIFGKAIQITQ